MDKKAVDPLGKTGADDPLGKERLSRWIGRAGDPLDKKAVDPLEKMGPRAQRVAELQAICRLARVAKRLIRWQSHCCAWVLAAAQGNGAGPADAPGRRGPIQQLNRSFSAS